MHRRNTQHSTAQQTAAHDARTVTSASATAMVQPSDHATLISAVIPGQSNGGQFAGAVSCSSICFNADGREDVSVAAAQPKR